MQNKKAIFLLLLSNVISGFAQGISMLSIPWYFANINKNEQLFGIAYTIITFASLFWSLYAGALIDRHSRKKVFLVINAVGAVALCGMSASGYLAGELSPYYILFIFCFTMFVYNIHYPCLYAFAQEVSERGNYGKINSLLEVQGQATTMAAGVVGAILLNGSPDGKINFVGIHLQTPFAFNAWKLHEIFLMDGITYVVAFFLILFIKYAPQVKEKIDEGNVFLRMKMGMDYLKNHKVIFLFGNCSYSIFVILLVEVHLLLAWYVNNHLHEGADVYAFAEVFYAVGALFAGLAIRKLFHGVNTVMSVIILMGITVGGLFWVSFSQNALIFYLFSGLIGITNAGTRVLRTTWLFQHVPNNVMGRVGSVFSVLNIFQRLVFSLIFSMAFFSNGSNVIWAYVIGGVFIFLNMLPVIFFYGKLKQKEI